jgi:hypothetical protein
MSGKLMSEKVQTLKWAVSQEAVTFPWLSAHSIRTGIEGDTYIVDPQGRLSRGNFQLQLVQFGKIPRANCAAIIDMFAAAVLLLLVLEAVLLPSKLAGFRPVPTRIRSVRSSRKWTRLSDN